MLFSATPETRAAAVVGNGQNAHFATFNAVDYRVWKPAQNKTAFVISPPGAQSWMLQYQTCRALKFRKK